MPFYLARVAVGVNRISMKVDDRSANLRMVTKCRKRPEKSVLIRNNALGIKGVYFHRASKSFTPAESIAAAFRKHLGSFDTSEAAATKFCAVVAEHSAYGA